MIHRTKYRLTVLQIRKAAVGQKLDDGAGLRLYKLSDGARWVYRYTIAGVRREMGLGGLEHVSLTEARNERDRWAMVLREGKDPISERERIRSAAAAALSDQDPTLEEITKIVFEARKEGLRADGERGRWMSPFEQHIFPKLGKRRISKLNQNDIADVLRPIWKTKHPTAKKAIQRLHIVFRQAKLMGRDVDPFTIEAAQHILGVVRHKTTSIVSTPWPEIPALYAKLDRSGASYDCLRWIILTAVRSESARGARFDEIEGDVWTIPADRIKAKEGKAEEFRVPLSTATLDLLEKIRERHGSEYLFPSYRKGHITDVAVSKVLNGLKEPGRIHGFRTSFRTWVQDNEAASYDVAETSLAHTVGNKVERVYARSDLLDPRRVLMERWAAFVTGQPAKVVRLRA